MRTCIGVASVLLCATIGAEEPERPRRGPQDAEDGMFPFAMICYPLSALLLPRAVGVEMFVTLAGPPTADGDAPILNLASWITNSNHRILRRSSVCQGSISRSPVCTR